MKRFVNEGQVRKVVALKIWGFMLTVILLGWGISVKGAEAGVKRRPGMISNEEYKAGMDQKKLALTNPEEALREEMWNACAAIALGQGYSIVLQFRQAHPMVAEYHRRVLVFSGTERRGEFSGALQLRMNFGGRTYMLVYRHLDVTGKVTHVTVETRDEARSGQGQSFRLNDPDFEAAPAGSQKEYLGLVSGEAFPLKFFSPQVLSEELAQEKLNR